MAHRISGEFDEAGAIESLVEKYGIEEGKDMQLNGIGKGIAMYVEEYLEGKVIKRLEELRAGVA